MLSSDTSMMFCIFFFFQAEAGIRDDLVTGVQTCALPICIRSGASVVPVTRLMNREEIVAAAPNTISFERDPALKKRIFDLLSLSTNEANGEDRLSSLFCCLPEIEAPPSLSYKDTFKVAIIQFLDRYNFDIGTVKRSCIHFATPDGRMIPFDTYNSFYRPGAPGRAKLAAMGGLPA